MKKLFDWFGNTGLFIAALFLLAFIPLYPKLPLIDVVQTWAYIRLEDVCVALAFLMLLAVKIRERKFVRTPLNTPIFVYLGVAFASLVFALIVIRPMIPTQLYPHLGLLHFLRRIEYLSVFFLAYEAFRRRPDLTKVIIVLTCAFLLVVLYGFGQKFFGFPAFLTMNEEFAKGIPLRLPSTARIPSTFGGHYDLGAYLVFTIPIIASLAFTVKKWFMKLFFFLLWIGGLVILLFTASRISFGVYLIAVSAMLLWKKKALFIIPVVAISILVLNLTSGASERFYKTFRVSNVVVDLSTGKPIGTLDKLEGMSATLEQSESPAKETLPKGSEFINLAAGPTDANSGDDQVIRRVEYTTATDLSTGSGEMATISGSFLVQKALVYDISITTRFQGQWPRAIAAFKRNILLGSGLSSLSLAADGDYFRMLGETGILGTIAFLGILVSAYVIFYRTKDDGSDVTKAFAIGAFGGLTGLLFNAVLIDVFEASKVAFTLWLVLGFAIAALSVQKPVSIPYFNLLRHIFFNPAAYIIYLCLAVFLLWGDALTVYFLGDDFTWIRWAAQSTTGDIIGYVTQAGGFFYRPIPKLWYFMLFSVFWLKPSLYHLASLSLVSATVILLYLFLKEQNIPKLIAWLTAFLFISLPIHHENMFWISGQSSLLAGLFLMLALFLFQRYWIGKGRWTMAYQIAGYASVFLSMLSYDGMMVAPCILFFLAAAIYKRGKSTWPVLLLMPLYWWMRTRAGAVMPSGDYGYKWSTFFVNAAGNGLGYGLGIVVGPDALEWMSSVRLSLRQHLAAVSTAAGIVMAVGATLILKFRKTLSPQKDAFIYLLCAIISMASYLGLGNTAERYAYIPSLFFLIACAVCVSVWQKSRNKRVINVILSALYLLAVWWNIQQIQHAGGDWKKASDVSQSSLLSIKNEIYPPKKDDLVFFIVNPPIRYGRAWIFPTGLPDALWLMFRTNLYKVIFVSTIQDAYEFQTDKGTRYVYVFEDYALKRGVQRTVEVPKQP